MNVIGAFSRVQRNLDENRWHFTRRQFRRRLNGQGQSVRHRAGKIQRWDSERAGPSGLQRQQQAHDGGLPAVDDGHLRLRASVQQFEIRLQRAQVGFQALLRVVRLDRQGHGFPCHDCASIQPRGDFSSGSCLHA